MTQSLFSSATCWARRANTSHHIAAAARLSRAPVRPCPRAVPSFACVGRGGACIQHAFHSPSLWNLLSPCWPAIFFTLFYFAVPSMNVFSFRASSPTFLLLFVRFALQWLDAVLISFAILPLLLDEAIVAFLFNNFMMFDLKWKIDTNWVTLMF